MSDTPHMARKRFGQNFLHDRGIIERIVRAIAPRPGDRIVEIGPGQGALTFPLLQAIGAMRAIEIDRDLIPRLAAAAPKHGTLEIIEADVLTVDFSALASDDSTSAPTTESRITVPTWVGTGWPPSRLTAFSPASHPIASGSRSSK